MSNPVNFADLSGWNAQPQLIQWELYKKWSENGGDVSCAALKASEGAGIIDPHFTAYRQGALDSGITSLILYHFGRPDLGNSPQAEADYAARAIGAIRESDVLCLDIEVLAPQATSAWVLAWLERMAAHYHGRLPALYSYDAYIRSRLQNARLSSYPLWYAAWNNAPLVPPACPPPWQHYTLWQFSDNFSVPGIPGTTDADIAFSLPTTSPQGGTVTTTTATSTPALLPLTLVGNYFTEVTKDEVWHCKIIDPKNPKHYAFDVSHGILAFYRALDPTHQVGHYAGLSLIGLPVSNEAYPPGKQNVAYQRFERAVVVYDPKRQMDNPTGTVGDCYLAHIDPLFDLQAQLLALTSTNTQLSSENTALKQQLATAQQDSVSLKQQVGQVETQNAALQQQYTALAQEKAALEQQPDMSVYQQFVSDVQAALAKVNMPPVVATSTQLPTTGGQA